MDNFCLLANAFRKHSFYILGAGASAPIIPITREQGELMVKRHLKFGVFSAETIKLDPGAIRLLGPSRFSDDQIKQELINRLPSGAIRAISMQLMSPWDLNDPPHQYIVFNKAKSPSVLWNYNIDRLASRYCKMNHIILYPHGFLDDRFTGSKEWDRIIDYCLFYHIEPPKIHGVILPGKEPIGISRKMQWDYAKKLFPYTEDYLVIIGYSFGFNGIDIDDWASLICFKNFLHKYKKKVLVIDPLRAQDIAEMLREEVKQKEIYPIPAYWNLLALAMLKAERIRAICPYIKDNHKLNLSYIYNSIIDQIG